MSRLDPPQLAAPPKLSALGLSALLAVPGGPSVFFPPDQAAASPVPVPATETVAAHVAHAPELVRPQSKRARRRAAGKLKEAARVAAASP